jgi:hypothetical protein
MKQSVFLHCWTVEFVSKSKSMSIRKSFVYKVRNVKFIKDWRFWLAVTVAFYVLVGFFWHPWVIFFGVIPMFVMNKLYQDRPGGFFDQIRSGKIPINQSEK